MSVLVPRQFHRIWLGPDPMPEEFARYEDTWLQNHSGWISILWTKEMLEVQFPHLSDLAARCERPSNASNVYRYALLHKHGGVYIDTDFECLKNIEPLVDGEDLFTAHQVDDVRNPAYLANGFFGCVPRHPALSALVDGMQRAFDPKNRFNLGPPYFTMVMRKFLPRILPRKLFYPYAWDELERRNEAFPEAYAVHHWGSKTQPFNGSRTIRL